METWIKLNSQTAGRDKVARMVQYLSKLLWYQLQQRNKLGVYSLKSLEYQLSTFRKLLRFGRCIDSIYGLIALLKYENSTTRTTVILSKISNALFLLTDHILWLGRADLCNINTNKWSQLSNKYWLYSITMNLVRDFCEIMEIIKTEQHRILSKEGCKTLNDLFRITGRTLLCIGQNRSVMVDTIKNSCDFFIPLTALGHIKLAPDTIGLLGLISSFAGLIAIIQQYKLVPS